MKPRISNRIPKSESEWTSLVQNKSINSFINYWVIKRCSSSVSKLGLDPSRELEDIKQEVWIKIWQQCEKGHMTTITKGAVGIIVQAVCRDMQRDNYNPMLETEPLDPTVPVEDHSGEVYDTKEALKRFMASLEPEDIKLFEARVHNDISYEELAQDMVLSIWVLKTRFIRLKLRLKEELQYEVSVD